MLTISVPLFCLFYQFRPTLIKLTKFTIENEKKGFEMLKVPSGKLYNIKYMMASTQKINTEISAFIAALVFKLLSRKVLFITRKENRHR